MQYPPPGKGFLGFQPPPNGSHLPTHGFQPWEMGSDNLVHPANLSIASAAPGIPNPYPCPVVPNQRFLANTMGTFSQPDSSSFDLTPSRPLAGITCTPPFPSIGPTHGNNYINVINFESPIRPNQCQSPMCPNQSQSPTHPNQSQGKKQKQVGNIASSQKHKSKYSL